MARVARRSAFQYFVASVQAGWGAAWVARFRGGVIAAMGLALIAAFATYHVTDPSFNAATNVRPANLLGGFGAASADVMLQSLGLGAWLIAGLMVATGLARAADRDPSASRRSSPASRAV